MLATARPYVYTEAETLKLNSMARTTKSNRTAPNPSTHTRILEAAFGLFRDKGIEATTTREIAELADVNEVTLFRHFGSKAGLIEATLRSCLAEAASQMSAGSPLRADASVEDILRTLAERVSQLSRQRSDVLLMVLRNVHQYPQLMHIIDDERAAMLQALRQFMQQQMDAGQIRRMDPAVASALLLFPLSLVHVLGTGVSRMTAPDLDVQAFERELIRMYMSYMLHTSGQHTPAT